MPEHIQNSQHKHGQTRTTSECCQATTILESISRNSKSLRHEPCVQQSEVKHHIHVQQTICDGSPVHSKVSQKAPTNTPPPTSTGRIAERAAVGAPRYLFSFVFVGSWSWSQLVCSMFSYVLLARSELYCFLLKDFTGERLLVVCALRELTNRQPEPHSARPYQQAVQCTRTQPHTFTCHSTINSTSIPATHITSVL